MNHDLDYSQIGVALLHLKDNSYTDIETLEEPHLSYGVYKFLGPTPSYSYVLPVNLLPTLVREFKIKIEV